jgi:hypothetical protein
MKYNLVGINVNRLVGYKKTAASLDVLLYSLADMRLLLSPPS